MSFNYDNMEERKTIFTTASESEVTSTTTSTYGSADNGNHSQSINVTESQFSPLATPFQSRNCNDFIGVERHEPTVREAEISAPSTSRVDYGILNDIPLMNNRDIQDQMGRARTDLQVDGDQFNNNNMGGSRSNAESVAGVNLFSAESGSVEASAQNAIDMELIVKCMSSANYYVSMLTREQLGVLRSIRPALLYEFLLEIAKVRSEKQQLRRALPNECAFCKNNGENEEYYLSHVLKDWRGRVLCPVLRAFRCPRCGATGDRAHTIKYCPHRPDAGFERAGFLPRRHAQSPPPSVNLGAAADIRRMGVMSPNVTENETTSLGSPDLNQHNWWSNYGL